MKTYKYIGSNRKWFAYVIKSNYDFHGFYNDKHTCLGYHYKEKQKGFWLSCFKQ
jgi:hypothetical protein